MNQNFLSFLMFHLFRQYLMFPKNPLMQSKLSRLSGKCYYQLCYSKFHREPLVDLTLHVVFELNQLQTKNP
jgi:hypothetical protein